MGLVDAFHPIFKLAFTFRQFFGDDVRASWKVARKGGIEKNGLADVKFMGRHGALAQATKESHTITPCQTGELRSGFRTRSADIPRFPPLWRRRRYDVFEPLRRLVPVEETNTEFPRSMEKSDHKHRCTTS
jgi:hypothetical protein